MQLAALDLEGFRTFRRGRIRFDPRLTVLVGRNGSGKSSVLDALHLLLSQYSARLIGSPSSGRRLRETDIRLGTDEARVRLRAHDEMLGELSWSMTKQGVRQKILKPTGSDLLGLNDYAKSIATRSNEGAFLAGETLPVYYDQSRTVLKIPQRRRTKGDDTPLSAFQDSVASSGINFPSLTFWFQDRETDELRRQKRRKNHVDRQLDAVRRAITSSTGLKNPYFSVEAPRGLTFEKGNLELHVSQLSTGERVYMALAADLARRLALTAGEGDPLSTRAIVLIDEIELHLHPTWQRQVLPWLLECFPNCQFVVTTHSPQVVSGIPSHQVVILQDGGKGTAVRTADSTLGRDSNHLLESVFGTSARDEAVARILVEADEAISRLDLALAAQLIRRLGTMIEGGSPEVAILQSRFQRRSNP